MHICNAVLRYLQVIVVFACPLLSYSDNCDVSKRTHDLLLSRHYTDVRECVDHHPGSVNA